MWTWKEFNKAVKNKINNVDQNLKKDFKKAYALFIEPTIEDDSKRTKLLELVNAFCDQLDSLENTSEYLKNISGKRVEFITALKQENIGADDLLVLFTMILALNSHQLVKIQNKIKQTLNDENFNLEGESDQAEGDGIQICNALETLNNNHMKQITNILNPYYFGLSRLDKLGFADLKTQINDYTQGKKDPFSFKAETKAIIRGLKKELKWYQLTQRYRLWRLNRYLKNKFPNHFFETDKKTKRTKNSHHSIHQMLKMKPSRESKISDTAKKIESLQDKIATRKTKKSPAQLYFKARCLRAKAELEQIEFKYAVNTPSSHSIAHTK